MVWSTQGQATVKTPHASVLEEEHTGIFNWDSEEGWSVWWIEAQMGTTNNPQPDLIRAERAARRLLMDHVNVFARRMMADRFTFRSFIDEWKLTPSHHSPMTVNPWTDRIRVRNEKPAVVKYALPHVVSEPVITNHLQDCHSIKRMLMEGVPEWQTAKMLGHSKEDVEAAMTLR